MQFDHLFERYSLVIINTASYLSWIISNGSQVIFFFLKGKIFLFYHIVSSNLFSPMRYTFTIGNIFGQGSENKSRKLKVKHNVSLKVIYLHLPYTF